jgi:hypothetical protein
MSRKSKADDEAGKKMNDQTNENVDEQSVEKASSRIRPDTSGKTRRQMLSDVRRRFERHMNHVLKYEDLRASPTARNPYGGLSRTEVKKRFARQPIHPLLRPLLDELKAWQRPAALKGIEHAVGSWGGPSARPYSLKKVAILEELYELRRQGMGAKKAAAVVAARCVGADGANSADQANREAAIYRLWLRRRRTAFSD